MRGLDFPKTSEIVLAYESSDFTLVYHLPHASQFMVLTRPDCLFSSKIIRPETAFSPEIASLSKHLPTSLDQPLPLPLVHHPLTLVLALPLCSICRVEQIVHITSHAAPARRRRRINPLEREPRAGQLPPAFAVARVIAAAIARVVAGSTACGSLM